MKQIMRQNELFFITFLKQEIFFRYQWIRCGIVLQGHRGDRAPGLGI